MKLSHWESWPPTAKLMSGATFKLTHYRPMTWSGSSTKSPLFVVPWQRFGVIFGGRNKLTAEGPFLDLLIKFRTEISKTKKFVVIGYSFRDDHINHLILSWLRGGNDRKMVVIDRPDGRREEIEFLGMYWRKYHDRTEYRSVGAQEGTIS